MCKANDSGYRNNDDTITNLVGMTEERASERHTVSLVNFNSCSQYINTVHMPIVLDTLNWFQLDLHRPFISPKMKLFHITFNFNSSKCNFYPLRARPRYAFTLFHKTHTHIFRHLKQLVLMLRKSHSIFICCMPFFIIEWGARHGGTRAYEHIRVTIQPAEEFQFDIYLL